MLEIFVVSKQNILLFKYCCCKKASTINHENEKSGNNENHLHLQHLPRHINKIKKLKMSD